MKLKSLILGSVAAAGLSTAGYAADLGVLTSLDVCDALGLSGLTISSDTNCLQISGGVKYEFYWGDYKDEPFLGRANLSDSILGGGPTSGNFNIIGAGEDPVTGEELDWRTKASAWLQFVGTADSDFGPAKAVIKLEWVDRYDVQNENATVPHDDNNAPLLLADGTGVGNSTVTVKEAYVAVGDATVLMAGKKGTIGNFGDAAPFNFLGLYGYGEVDNGVLLEGDEDGFGGHVIQIVSDLGNGVSVGVGLENLDGNRGRGFGGLSGTDSTGTLVGVVSYTGESLTAHLTGFTGGVIDGELDFWGLHAGATGTFDAFKVRGAFGYLHNDLIDDAKLHALLSASATFDMFTIAVSGEYADVYGDEGWGAGASIGATVLDGIKVNLGGRWWHNDSTDEDTAQVALQVVAAVTETIEVTGELGAHFFDEDLADAQGLENTIGYGALGLKWAPGGGFTSTLKGEATTESAYKISFTAEKTFQ